MTTEDAADPAWERSPADLLRLVVAAIALSVVLILQALFGGTLVTFGHDLLSGLHAIPSWIVTLVVSVTRVLAVVFLAGGLVLTIIRSRAR
jgi:hypothetical protein